MEAISAASVHAYWAHEVSLASVWRGQSAQSGVIASLVQSGVVANLAGYLLDWTGGGFESERHPPEQRLNNNSGRSRTKDQVPKTEEQGPRTKDRRPRTKDQGPSTEDQGPRTEDRRTRIKDQGPKTKDQGPRTEDQRSMTEGQGPKTKDFVQARMSILEELWS